MPNERSPGWGGARPGAGRKKGSRWSDEHRQRISVNALIDRVQAFALGEPDPRSPNRKCEMNTAQVTAALKLIGKAVPDLAAVQLSGDEDAPVTYRVVIGAAASVTEDDAPNAGD